MANHSPYGQSHHTTLPARPPPSLQRHPQSPSFDIEKQHLYPFPDRSFSPGVRSMTSVSSNRQRGEDVASLLSIVFLLPILSLAVFIYTLLTMLLALVIVPLGCLFTTPCPTTFLKRLLLGPVRLEARLLFVGDVLFPRQHNSAHTEATTRAGRLVALHLLAPLLSLPSAAWGFIVAFFWALSLAIGSDATPSQGVGDGRRMDDGRHLARRLREWWVGWLEWPLEEQQQQQEEQATATRPEVVERGRSARHTAERNSSRSVVL